jgi:hypothetical protein
VALVEPAGVVIVAKAFEACGALRLGMGEKQRAAALPARLRVHEQHVDMRVDHEEEADRGLVPESDEHPLPFGGKTVCEIGGVPLSKSLLLQDALERAPVGTLRDARQHRDVRGTGAAHPHGWPRRRGSRVSRRASPRRLKPKDRNRIAKPAKIALQGDS